MRKLTVYRDEGSIDMEMIEAFEKEIGYCLPVSYKQLISRHNELRIEEDTFDFINVYKDNDERDIYFFGYGDVESEHIKNQQYVSDPMEYGQKGLVAFGGCANGDIVCFDYRNDPKTCEPKIVLVYHDDYIEHEDGTSTRVVNHIANSFDEFLDMLYGI